jgi:hypothetical protein
MFRYFRTNSKRIEIDIHGPKVTPGIQQAIDKLLEVFLTFRPKLRSVFDISKVNV